MNDKLNLISDISLSDREMAQEKDNSIQNKSFYSTDLDIPDLISKKEYFQIKIIRDEDMVDLTSKSIKKILTLISGDEKEILEENYLDYITWLIGYGDEIERQQLLTQNDQVDNIETNLISPEYQLLSKTKIYYINIPKENENNQINKRIKIKNISLEKISSFLGLSIFDIRGYIEICILSFTDKENFENKKSLKTKLIGKFNNEINNEYKEITKEEDNIRTKFNLLLKESKKCKRTNLNSLEDYFEKVWNKIDEKANNEENKNKDKSENSSELVEEEENNNKKNYDIPNSFNINQNFNKNIEKAKIVELRDENICGDNICANLCKIF